MIAKPLTAVSVIQEAALAYINAGLRVLPCDNKIPTERIKRNLRKLKDSPLHEQNYAFYFSEATQVALYMGNEFECIDVDSKYDLTKNLWNQLLSAIKYALRSEVYDSLVIERTPSGGYHIFYKCHQIGGNQKFASRHATAIEKEFGERVKVLVESRGEGGYVVCCPSPGYEMVKGELEDIQSISIDDRALLLNICRSFDQCADMVIPGLNKREMALPDAPWNVFNKANTWEWMVDKLKELDWEVVDDNGSMIRVRRPGTSAKSSGAIFKDSSLLYLFSTSTEFEAGKPISAFGMHCILSFDGNVKDCARQLAEQGIGKWNAQRSEFYNVTEKGKPEINHSAIVDWMKEIGYRKHWYSKTDYDLVQISGSIVKQISLDKIKKTFGSYIKENVPEKVYNLFLSTIKSLFSKEGLISQLDDLNEGSFIKSSQTNGWVFFNNGAFHVNKETIERCSYDDLEIYGLIWEKNIIPRDFFPGDSDGDISNLIKLLSGDRPASQAMFNSAIGYLLHKYKDPANPITIILNDEYYDDNGTEPQGGTGKGLFIKLLANFRNIYSVDGKRINFESSFTYQGITPDTEIFAIEDAKKGFDFEKMFSVITEDWAVEQKGRTPFIIPYERSPKILITSNYAIKGSSSSHLRRRYELELAPYFSFNYRPLDHFGHRLFEDWDRSEWNRFDNYMINCLQGFLKTGLSKEITINLKRKKLVQETNADFVRWMDLLLQTEGLPKQKIRKEDFKDKFTELYPDYMVKLSMAKFTQWLVRWCDDFNIDVDTRNSYNGSMVYSFKTASDLPSKTTSTFINQPLEKVRKETKSACKNELDRPDRYRIIGDGQDI